jgi:hypothetical protein
VHWTSGLVAREGILSRLALITLALVCSLTLMSRALSHSSGHFHMLPLWLGQSFTKPVQLSTVTWHSGQDSPLSRHSLVQDTLHLLSRLVPVTLPPIIPTLRLQLSGIILSNYAHSPLLQSSVAIASSTPFHTAGYGYLVFLATCTCVFPPFPVFYGLHYLMYRSQRPVLPYGLYCFLYT